MYPAWDTLQHAIRAWWKVAWQKAGKTLPVSFFVNSLLGRCKKGTGRGWEKSANAGNSGRSRPWEKGGPQSQKKFFPALRASFWSKNKAGGTPGPLPWSRHWGKGKGVPAIKAGVFVLYLLLVITSRGLNSQYGRNLITLLTRNCQVEMLFLSDIIISWNKTFLLFLLPQQTR